METAHLNTTLQRSPRLSPPPMAITSEQRSAISRANGARSKGPTTDAGKSISSRNSLKHGMTAKKIALPNEDPAAVAARAEEWDGHFRPVSPDARILLT